jgi:predicted nucleic acid-binding protein
MRQREPALRKLAEIQDVSVLHYVSSPTVMELAVGVALADLPNKEQERINDVLEEFEIIPLDTASAWRAGMELGRLRTKGEVVDPIDGQIAGIALYHNEPVVTRNLKHFQKFKDLKIEPY